MMSIFGRSIALAAVVLVATGAIAPGAGAVSIESPSGAADSREFSSRTAVSSSASLAPCQDRAFNLIGGRWSEPVRWRFNAGSAPPGFNVGAIETVLIKSFNNITGAHNDCGRADRVGAQNRYRGRTERSPNISRLGLCTGGDGRNVVGFGALPRGVLAVTCMRRSRNLILEADIRINSRYEWAVSAAACSNQELLEPTVTHEVGHVFGLDHVGDRRHPLLTMSTRSDGPCSNAASTLGLGDMLGLEELY